MTDTVKSWIGERRAVHAKATPGEWQADGFADELGGEPIIRLSIWSGPPSSKESPIVVHSIRHHGNTGFILDAHNMFPRALDALSAVIELHKPLGYIGRDGETVWDECEHCYGSGWPCETVQAIEGAINHD